jgi:chaperonin GroES
MIQPIGPRVLVKRIDAPKPTSSTIIIPESVDGEKSNFALVLAVGTGVREDIKVADTVVLAQYCGSPLTTELDGEVLEAHMVTEADVLGVLRD